MNTHPWSHVTRSFFVSAGAGFVSMGCILVALNGCKSRSFNKGNDASGVRNASAGASGKTDVFDKPIENWGSFPDDADLEALLSPGLSYVNYATSAPKTPEVDLPGKVVVAGMKAVFDKYKTEYVGNASKGGFYAAFSFNDDRHSYTSMVRECMSTVVGNRHYSDLQLGYYCLLVGARQCYTYGAQSFVGEKSDDILPAGAAND